MEKNQNTRFDWRCGTCTPCTRLPARRRCGMCTPCTRHQPPDPAVCTAYPHSTVPPPRTMRFLRVRQGRQESAACCAFLHILAFLGTAGSGVRAVGACVSSALLGKAALARVACTAQALRTSTHMRAIAGSAACVAFVKTRRHSHKSARSALAIRFGAMSLLYGTRGSSVKKNKNAALRRISEVATATVLSK